MNIPSKKFLADSQAFLAYHDQPFVFDPLKRPQLNLALVATMTPSGAEFGGVLKAHQAFVGNILSNEGIHLIRTREDLDTQGMGVLLGMQGAPDKITFGQLRALRDDGLRVMSIVRDGQNEYGCGCGSSNDTGLTARGRELIGWISELGMILDISRAGHRTGIEAFRTVALRRTGHQDKIPPVMASCSGCHAVHPHSQNLPDDFIARFGLLGGYLGISAAAPLVAYECDDCGEAFIRHVEYALQVCCGEIFIGISCGNDSLVEEKILQMAQTEKLSHRTTVEGILGKNFRTFLRNTLS